MTRASRLAAPWPPTLPKATKAFDVADLPEARLYYIAPLPAMIAA
ncbi:hypothetical protein [Candidatus Chloroploca mongolica]|nr:hypothetical protein [Candidatus Chloroploca mongolica]